MATFKVTKKTTVAELKSEFQQQVGGLLHVYNGRSEAAEDATLVSLGAKEGVLECRTSRTVGKFEEAFQSELNLKVKVYTKDNWVKVLDGITLATVKDLPNGMTKAKMEEYLAYQRDEETADPIEKVEEIDVIDGYDLSVALAENTQSAAAAFHKVGDGYDDEEKVLSDIYDYPDNFFVLLKKDGKFYLYRDAEWDDVKGEYVEKPFPRAEADEIYYRDHEDIKTSEEVENNIVMNNHVWPCEDFSLDNAIEDVLSGTNEYKWPHIDIDFIYNGKVFFSFTL